MITLDEHLSTFDPEIERLRKRNKDLEDWMASLDEQHLIGEIERLRERLEHIALGSADSWAGRVAAKALRERQ